MGVVSERFHATCLRRMPFKINDVCGRRRHIKKSIIEVIGQCGWRKNEEGEGLIQILVGEAPLGIVSELFCHPRDRILAETLT